MNHDIFKSGLDLYGTVWKIQDPKLIKKIFTKFEELIKKNEPKGIGENGHR